MSSFIFVCTALNFLSVARADLPVHCVQPQIIGLWRFHVGSYGAIDGGSGDPQCGYAAPDSPNAHQELTPPVRDAGKKEQGQYWLNDKFKAAFTLEIALRDWTGEVLSVAKPGIDGAKDDSVAKEHFPGGLPRGEFTMVYDEAIRVGLQEENGDGHSFLAFSKYMLGAGDDAGSGDNNVNAKHSFCDHTLLGWHKRLDPVTQVVKHHGCWWGERIGSIEGTPLSNGPLLPLIPGVLPQKSSPKIGGAANKADFPASMKPSFDGRPDEHSLRGVLDTAGSSVTSESVIGTVLRNPFRLLLLLAFACVGAGLWAHWTGGRKQDSTWYSKMWLASYYLAVILVTVSVAAFAVLSWRRHFLHEPIGLATSATGIPDMTQKRGTSINIKDAAQRVHQQLEAARQNNQTVLWKSDPEQFKAWVRERRELHGIEISEDSEIERLVDMMAPPLAIGIPGFSTEETVGPARAAGQREQATLAKALGKKTQELTMEDMNGFWNSTRTNHHTKRQFTMGDKPIGADDWKTLKDFDWREVSLQIEGGKAVSNFVPVVPDQGGCGSCYAVATAGMITSRLMLRYPELHERFASEKGKERISVDQQLSCNHYNQGCAGGYPYLTSQWSFENDVVSEKCYLANKPKDPPVGLRNQQTCASKFEGPACAEKFRVHTWRYVGGAFGRCGFHHVCEAAVREELYKGGPLVVAIEPAAGFGYKEGAYHGIPGVEDKKLVSEARSAKEYPDCKGEDCFVWRKIDHAVLLVAWGEDVSTLTCQALQHKSEEEPSMEDPCVGKSQQQCSENEKCSWRGYQYWTIQNSWGAGWGKDGYFSFGPRGQDPMRVESMSVAGDVERVLSEDKHTDPTKLVELRKHGRHRWSDLDLDLD